MSHHPDDASCVQQLARTASLSKDAPSLVSPDVSVGRWRTPALRLAYGFTVSSAAGQTTLRRTGEDCSETNSPLRRANRHKGMAEPRTKKE
jgi:hypothetical protein